MSKRQKPKWTIMVYLAGDNDLTSHCVSILQQLEAVRYRNDVCVLACFESSTPWPRGSRYLEVNCSHRGAARRKKAPFDWELHNDLIPPDSEKDANPNKNGSMSRPVVAEGLRQFIDWAVSKHKDSERYMLILFGHGPLVAGQTFLVSENPGSFLRLDDLQEVLDEHFGEGKRQLDVLAFQNCVMNGIETAYEIRNHANYVIGSQGLVLATGWPYEKMVEAVLERPSAATATIARKMLKACARNMLDFTIMDRSSEQSACNLAALRDSSTITTALRSLVKALKEGLEIKVQSKEKGKDKERFLLYPEIADAVRLARLEAQSYWWEMFVDLYDFCERLIQKCNELVKAQDRLLVDFGIQGKARAGLADTDLVQKTRSIVACCIDVLAEIRELVPSSHSYYIGSSLQYSHGLSIYFPWSFPVGPYFPRPTRSSKEYRLETAFHTYNQYSFVKQSNWGEFLEVFFKATIRNMRRANRSFEMRKNLTNLEAGLAIPHYESPGHVALTSDLQKSSPDTARADFDMSFNIKNYPRRHYLSPADDKRRIDDAGAINAGEGKFKDATAPPVSSLGWNFPPLVSEVIRRKPSRKRQPKVSGSKGSSQKPPRKIRPKVVAPSGSAKTSLQKSPRNSERIGDSDSAFERAASPKSRRNGQHNVGAGNPLAKVASPRHS